MGRKRETAASRTASMYVQTCLLPLVGKFDNKNTVLGHHADQHDQSYLAENIQCLSRDNHGKECTDKSQRDCHEYDNRVTEALELRCKNKVDQYNGQHKGKEKA